MPREQSRPLLHQLHPSTPVSEPRVSTTVFGSFELDDVAFELRRAGVVQKIQKKPLEILVHLVRHRDRVVPKAELLDELWPGVSVSEEALASAIRDLRRVLEDTNRAAPIVLTLRGRGYRFVGQVRGGAQRPPQVEGAPVALGSAWEGTFVDRDDSMKQLEDALGAAMAGQLRLSLLAGPAGIGKTRAALELSRSAELRGVETHVGRCYEGDGATPFWPWLQIVRSCIAARGVEELRHSLGDTLQHLAWIAPELAAPGGAESRADLTGAEARFRLFDATARFLVKLGETRPLLIVLEDLHWGDEATLLLLEFIVQSVSDARVHLVATFRDDEAGRSLTQLLGTSARRMGTERIDLSGLQRESVLLLLSRAVGKTPSPAFVDAVFDATAGNPFFVVELTRLAMAGKLEVTGDPRVMPVPVRVRDAIRLQLKRLPPDGERLLALASIVGREFHAGVLAHASGESLQRVLSLLAVAETTGLLRAAPDAPGRFSFVHDLVRETIRLGVPLGERAELHRRMAEGLAAVHHAEPAPLLRELAHHYSEAASLGDRAVAEKAVTFSRRAAESANANMAFEDAVAQYDRALAASALLSIPTPEVRCELLLSQAEAAWGTRERAGRVQERFVAAADAARTSGSASLLARAALGRTGHGGGPGDYRDIFAVDPTDIELLSEALGALPAEPSTLKARVLARLSLAVRYADGFERADALSREAVEIGERLADVETLATGLRYRHEVLSGPSHAAERLKIATRVLELARKARSRPLELDALYFLARANFELGNIAPAGERGAAADALAQTMRHPGAHFRSGIRQVLIETVSGAFGDAERHAREFLERDGARNLTANTTFSAQMAMIASLRDDHDAAIRYIEDPSIAPTVQWRSHAAAREHARAGRLAVARESFERAAANRFAGIENDHMQLGSLMHLAEVCADLGDVERAGELHSRMLPFAGMIAAPFIATACQGAVSRGLGVLASTLHRWDEAESHFIQARALEESFGAAPLIAHTLQRHGALLLAHGRSGDQDRGREMLGRATKIAERIGMRDLARRSGSQRDGATVH
jgi:eukaryotic-like serine/threonine-protein kinase